MHASEEAEGAATSKNLKKARLTKTQDLVVQMEKPHPKRSIKLRHAAMHVTPPTTGHQLLLGFLKQSLLALHLISVDAISMMLRSF